MPDARYPKACYNMLKAYDDKRDQSLNNYDFVNF